MDSYKNFWDEGIEACFSEPDKEGWCTSKNYLRIEGEHCILHRYHKAYPDEENIKHSTFIAVALFPERPKYVLLVESVSHDENYSLRCERKMGKRAYDSWNEELLRQKRILDVKYG